MAWNSLDSDEKLIDELIDSLLEKHIVAFDWISNQQQFDAVADELNKKLYKATYDWLKLRSSCFRVRLELHLYHDIRHIPRWCSRSF